MWRKIPLTKADIDLKTLLTCGQSFTWKETSPNIWSNVIGNVVFSLSQSENALMWCTPCRDQNEIKNIPQLPSIGLTRNYSHAHNDEILGEHSSSLSVGANHVRNHITNSNDSHNHNDNGDTVIISKCPFSESDTDTHRKNPVSVKSETLTDPDNVISAPPKAKESHNRCRKRQDSSDLLTNFKRKTTKLSSDLDFEPDNDNAKKLKIESEPPGHYYCAEDDKIYEQKLVDYFQLGIDLSALYKQWSSADKHFQLISDRFSGIRIMRQDPTENLFAFICSSNNHVSRISGMVNKLSQNYGTKLGTVDGTDLYSFPTADKLTGSKVESHLRELGFGYRAKYIVGTAKVLHMERPEGFLNSLRDRPYEECITELTKFLGVGRKVADCVALMSLDKSQVVPVDTHVLQIAIRDYSIPGVTKNTRSLTPALHDKIGKYFIDLYGDHAGWAHTVLFAADLKRFSDHKPVSKKTPPAPKKRQKSAKSAK